MNMAINTSFPVSDATAQAVQATQAVLAQTPVQQATSPVMAAPDTPLGAVMQSPQLDPNAGATAEAASAAVAEEDTRPGYQKFLGIIEGDTPKQDTVVVDLYADGCLDCKHLVEGADTDFVKCHFSRGNVHCPAANVKIQFVGARVRWDKKIEKIEAMEAGIGRTNAQIAMSIEAQEIEEESLRTYVLGKLFR
jgi:hypothetical protein